LNPNPFLVSCCTGPAAFQRRAVICRFAGYGVGPGGLLAPTRGLQLDLVRPSSPRCWYRGLSRFFMAPADSSVLHWFWERCGGSATTVWAWRAVSCIALGYTIARDSAPPSGRWYRRCSPANLQLLCVSCQASGGSCVAVLVAIVVSGLAAWLTASSDNFRSRLPVWTAPATEIRRSHRFGAPAGAAPFMQHRPPERSKQDCPAMCSVQLLKSYFPSWSAHRVERKLQVPEQASGCGKRIVQCEPSGWKMITSIRCASRRTGQTTCSGSGVRRTTVHSS